MKSSSKQSLQENPLKPLVVPAVILFLICGATFFAQAAVKTVVKTPPIAKKAPVAKLQRSKPLTPVQKTLDAIRVTIPQFDLSASPIPNLKFTPLNLALPQLPGKGMLKNFGVDKDVSYAGGAVRIMTPEVDVTPYIPKNLPTGSTGGQPTNIPTTPAAQPSNTPTTQQPTVPEAAQPNAANCAQFNGIPSCSYVGDPNGQTLCNQCKTGGF